MALRSGCLYGVCLVGRPNVRRADYRGVIHNVGDRYADLKLAMNAEDVPGGLFMRSADPWRLELVSFDKFQNGNSGNGCPP